MALTQIQIIQSLGEAMNWFSRELERGIQPTELRHLSGRIGEMYAALITDGQMATAVNQKGYDVVSSHGERISVKTTAKMKGGGHFSFNPNTLGKVDRVIIFRINTEEMQIETLLNETKDKAIKLMSKPNARGRVCISLSKLIKKPRKRDDNLLVVKEAKFDHYLIQELENGTIEVQVNGEFVSPAKPILREIATKRNISLFNSNGNTHNTRQLGSLLIKTIEE